MVSKSVFSLVLIAAANLVSATPPACLLGAINTQPNPADLENICGQNASKVQVQIRSLCGANTGAAMSAFSSICSAAGHKIATFKPTGSAKKTTAKNTTAKKTTIKTTSHHLTQPKHSTKTDSSTKHSTKVTTKTKMSPKPSGHSSSRVQHTTESHSSTVARETNTAVNAVSSSGPNDQSTSKPSSSPKPFDSAAGQIDAQGFAELALAAAGLLIFL